MCQTFTSLGASTAVYSSQLVNDCSPVDVDTLATCQLPRNCRPERCQCGSHKLGHREAVTAVANQDSRNARQGCGRRSNAAGASTLSHNRSSSDAEGYRLIYICLVTGAVQELGWCPAVCVCQEGAHAPHHWCPRHHSRSGHPRNDGPLAHPCLILWPPWLTLAIHCRATREVLPFDSVTMTG